MRGRLVMVAIVLGVIATGLFRMLVPASPVEAQGVSPQLLAGYLDRSGLTWKRDSKDQNVLRVTKTSGLKRASKVEIVVTNIPDKSLVTVRSFPQTEGKYLSLSLVTDKQGLMKDMLSRNATAFGSYFWTTRVTSAFGSSSRRSRGWDTRRSRPSSTNTCG